MPIKDPSNWQHLLDMLSRALGGIFEYLSRISHDEVQGAHLHALCASIAIAMVRAIATGQGGPVARIVKGASDALMCGAILLFVIPAVEMFDVPRNASIVAGGAIAFMGTDWLRKVIVAWASRLLDKIGPGEPLD